jgi:hypothetical protein
VERITSLVHLGAVGIVEAGVLENGMGFGVSMLRASLLSCRCGLGVSLLSCPLRRESTFALGEVVETSAVVVKPKIELQVLGGMLNVLEVIHEVADGAWLVYIVSVDQYGLREDRSTNRASAIVEDVVEG